MRRRVCGAFAWIALSVAPLAPASAQSVESFYKGKTLRFLVGYGPGTGYDVYMREAAAKPSNHGLGESEQPLNNAARVHHVGDEDEERHREQKVAVVKAVHRLIDDEADILMRRQKIADAGRDHALADRRAKHCCAKENRDQNPQSK